MYTSIYAYIEIRTRLGSNEMHIWMAWPAEVPGKESSVTLEFAALCVDKAVPALSDL